MMTQTSNGKKNESKTLDLDSLALEPIRIKLPDGSCLYAKDMTVELYLQFTEQVRKMNEASAMDRFALLADAIVVFMEDETEAQRQLDQMPLPVVAKIWSWLRELKEPEFEVVLPDTLATITIDGSTHLVPYPSVAAYRKMIKATNYAVVGKIVDGAPVKVTPRELYDLQLDYLSALIPTLSVDELMDMNPRKVHALDDYVTTMVAEALQAWLSEFKPQARPTQRPRAGAS